MFLSRPLRHPSTIAALVGAALLVVSYLAFSLRAVTDPVEPGQIVDLKRFLAAAAGAGMFWVISRHARRGWVGQTPERFAGIALLSVAALGLVLAVRIGYDMVFAAETQVMLIRNLRWTIIWLGYFGTALLGYFAVVFGLSLRRIGPIAEGTAEDRLASLLTEIAHLPAAERSLLADVLAAPLRYEEADPLFADRLQG